MNIRTIKSNSTVFLLLISGLIYGAARDSSKMGENNFIWGSMGVGGLKAFQYGGSIFYINNKHLFAVRYIKGEEVVGIVQLEKKIPFEKSEQFAITYGRFLERKKYLLSGSLGISWSKGIRRGEFLYNDPDFFFPHRYYEDINYSTIGAPVDVQVFWKIGKFCALGLSGNADINPQRTTYGILLLNVHLGKLPNG